MFLLPCQNTYNFALPYTHTHSHTHTYTHTHTNTRTHTHTHDPAGSTWQEVRAFRLSKGIIPSYKRIDTCAAEFAADTPYMYSCYDGVCESKPVPSKKVKKVFIPSVHVCACMFPAASSSVPPFCI